MVALGATTCPSKTLLGQLITIVNFGRAHQVRKTIRDAFQKKNSIWRDIVPTRGGGGKKNLWNVPT